MSPSWQYNIHSEDGICHKTNTLAYKNQGLQRLLLRLNEEIEYPPVHTAVTEVVFDVRQIETLFEQETKTREHLVAVGQVGVG